MKIEKIVVGSYEENCYLVIKGKEAIVIDPGDEFSKIDTKIKNLGVNVVGILITHAHFDHVGALEDMVNKYSVPLYYNNINSEIIYDKLVNIEETEYDISDFKFRVINTPGHRNDSVTYYFYDDNTMFTGDFLFKGTIGRTDLEYASYDEMKNSIEKIKNYDDNIVIYPGHGEESSLKWEKENNLYLC